MTRITSPFGYRTTGLQVVEGRNLHGRVAIVTGASSGLGAETARSLGAGGAEVTMAVRDVQKAAPILNRIREVTRNDRVNTAQLDLASLASVRRFAQGFLVRRKPLHILVNNAGVMACPLGRTEDGFELQFGTNYIGHFLLTLLLRPALEAGAPSRVVSLTSIGHRRSDIHFEDLNYQRRPYEKWEAYGQSKTANALLAVGLTRRWASRGIHSNAVMPGGILTRLQQHLSKEEMMALGWIDASNKPNERFKTPAQGAATSVWAAVGAELEGVGGLYLEDCAQAEPWTAERPFAGYLPHALDPVRADRLFALCEELVRARG